MRMPTCLVLALLTMQPRLEAEESILAVNRIAVASGSLKEADANALQKQWGAAANPAGIERPKPQPAAALSNLGIPVRRVKTQRKKTA